MEGSCPGSGYLPTKPGQLSRWLDTGWTAGVRSQVVGSIFVFVIVFKSAALSIQTTGSALEKGPLSRKTAGAWSWSVTSFGDEVKKVWNFDSASPMHFPCVVLRYRRQRYLNFLFYFVLVLLLGDHNWFVYIAKKERYMSKVFFSLQK